MSFQRFVQCALTAILIFTMAAAGLTYAKAEEPDFYDAPVEDIPAETPASVSDSVVSVQDAAVLSRLDSMQETLDAIAVALAPEETAQPDEQLNSDLAAPDYSGQLATISNQLGSLQDSVQASTAETAQPSAFSKSFEEYSVSEVLLLVLVAVAAVFLVLNFFRIL